MWDTLGSSPDETSSYQNPTAFKEQDERAVKYAMSIWVTPYKAKIIAYLVDQKQYFGYTTTLAIESSHAVLKKHLLFSTGDLKNVFQGLQ